MLHVASSKAERRVAREKVGAYHEAQLSRLVEQVASAVDRHRAGDVIRRYDWGKTKGYQNLKDRSLVPPPVMTHPDRWRLDWLLAWKEKRMALAEEALEAVASPEREELSLTDLPPTQATTAGMTDRAARDDVLRISERPDASIECVGFRDISSPSPARKLLCAS